MLSPVAMFSGYDELSYSTGMFGSRFEMKVEFFNHRTLGQAAKVTAHSHAMFYVLDGVWRDADSVEQVVLTKIPGVEWARDIWIVPGKQQSESKL